MEPLASMSFDYEGFKYTTDENGVIVTKEEIMVEETPVEDVAPVVEEEVVMEEVGEEGHKETPATETAENVEDIAESVAEDVTGPIEEVDVVALQVPFGKSLNPKAFALSLFGSSIIQDSTTEIPSKYPPLWSNVEFN